MKTVLIRDPTVAANTKKEVCLKQSSLSIIVLVLDGATYVDLLFLGVDFAAFEARSSGSHVRFSHRRRTNVHISRVLSWWRVIRPHRFVNPLSFI